MQPGTDISAHDLLNEIQQATLDVAATSAHVGRRLREAKLSRQVEELPIGEARHPPA
jgi:hypothetical protein